MVSVFALFVFGFSWRDLQRGALPSGSTVRSLFGSAVSDQDATSPSEEFEQAFNRIKTDYYKTVESDKLTYAGMEGLMASLGDPHTMFLEPKQAQEFSSETRANFVGVGARLSPDPLGAKVMAVFDEGPARTAGMKNGDIITGVNGKSVVGRTINDIVSQIRGEEGTTVTLQILRNGSSKPITLSAKRARVVTPTVWDTKVLPGTKIGYFIVQSFSEPTAEQFDTEVAALEKQNIKGLIIDLRDNPGGLLETDRDMLSRFFEDKVVVKMKLRTEEDTARTFSGTKHNFNYPIAVLMNEETASAAEIFAGCLQDYQLATLVGTHSYGKASVQNVSNLVGGASAKITIARYFLPSGRDIGRKVDEDGQYIKGGLDPDVKATLNTDKTVTIGDPASDSQLAKAIEVVQKKIGS